MGFRPEPRPAPHRTDDLRRAQAFFHESAALARKMQAALPSHRELLDHVAARGMPAL
jgi:tryptophan 7-halogenase